MSVAQYHIQCFRKEYNIQDKHILEIYLMGKLLLGLTNREDNSIKHMHQQTSIGLSLSGSDHGSGD